ncbi:MAG TPA: sulfotransferase [Capillimicrobium sp.]|nr:sulfotransferase [Capillimicrobium sp.]
MPDSHLRTGPPDFIGVGAQRSGTTWWFRILLEHPQVKAARDGDYHRKKEVHFFDEFCAREMTQADLDRYYGMFPRKDGQIAGEWTPRYMANVWTARLLKRAAPDAKILVMLRDPIERYRSGIVHRETRAPHRRPETICADAIERGRYATQIERLYRHFDRDRVLVLQYERCRQDPAGEYRRTLEFLGVDPDFVPRAERPRGTTTAAGKKELWEDMRVALRAALDPEVARLPELVPDIDLSLWPNFADVERVTWAS